MGICTCPFFLSEKLDWQLFIYVDYLEKGILDKGAYKMVTDR